MDFWAAASVPAPDSVTVKAPDGTPQIVEPVFDPYTNEYTLTAVTDSIAQHLENELVISKIYRCPEAETE